MPMEQENDGEGKALLSIQLTEDRILELIGKGTYGRERHYSDKANDEMRESMKDIPNFEPINDEADPTYLGFIDWHRISFVARITSDSKVAAAA